MTLHLVKPEGPKPARPKGAPRHEASVLTPEEERKARQAIRNLKNAFGTWACLAKAMGMPEKSLITAVQGERYGLSPAVLLRAMRASGLTLDDMLGNPALAGRCRSCGALRRAS